MPQSRESQIDLQVTEHYHVISRCVRRAYLAGNDEFSGKNYEHRKRWVLERMRFLGQFFAIEVCAYAIMSNHYHLVLRANQLKAMKWSAEDVKCRWKSLFPMTQITTLDDEEQVAIWRRQLCDISWYMRALNEYISRKANQEDECRGRFWEGRFKSQALMDEGALLTCMAYVDLNPMRAGIADLPEVAEFTSIHERLYDVAKKQRQISKPNAQLGEGCLVPFQRGPQVKKGSKKHRGKLEELDVPIPLQDYLCFIDAASRIYRDGKATVAEEMTPILERLGLEEAEWFETMSHLETSFSYFLGSVEKLQSVKQKQGKAWVKGEKRMQKAYLKKVA